MEVRDGDRPLALGGVKQRSVLALLLLRRGEVVSADVLIDALWGDAPPEDSATALQQHVSRLRRALEPHTVVRTRAPGYVIERDAGQVDLERFEALRDAGRRQLEAGEAAAAAATLREGLALWRGRPLGDLELEQFAADAVARLDDAWIETVELRVEADLALGRHDVLTTELRALVRHHPLRERLRAQLMLALYRAGRQGEALEVYADARRELSEELGLAPGPVLQRLQQRVLEHDPSLELRERAAPRPGAAASRHRWPLLAGAAAVAAVVAIAVAAGGGEDGDGRAAVAGGSTLVAFDAATGDPRLRFPVGRTPASVAGVAGGRLWVVDADARTLLAVDAGSGEVETLATGGTPTEVAVGDGVVWVGNGRPLAAAQHVGPVTTELVRIDPATRTERATIGLPAARGAVLNAVDNRLSAHGGAVWAATPSGGVARIESATSEVTATQPDVRAIAVAAGPAGVFALRPDGRVLRLDEQTGEVIARTRLPTDAPTAIAVGEEAAFATSSTDATLWRIGTDGEVGAVEVGSGVTDVVADASAAWVANPLTGTLTRVDARTMRVTRTVRVDGLPRALTLHDGRLWAVVAGEAGATTTQVSGLDALPPATCEPLIAAKGGPADVLVVSDLPLQGGLHVTTSQMVQAITFVLRERGFAAGEKRVGFQSCDDSVARTGLFDEAKCAANARAYARNPDVVAVIGTLNSPCALAAVPELNRAPGGPLAMVSPLNSFVGLTRRGTGIPPTLLSELYPTGKRNYVRVFPTDDLQGAALALLARDHGHESVYVLDDGEPGYGKLMAGGFRTAARRLGLRIAGSATWAPQARTYRRLARRVAASGAQAAFLGGLLDTNAAQVVRDLRARAPHVSIMGPDGLTPLPLLSRKAGLAARDVLVALPGIVTEELPPEGDAFVRRFARTQPGAVVEPAAVYAAQATQVVLDAIARSDGTRASVLEELFAARVEDGLLGDFAFDERGDISESPVTILRVAAPGEPGEVASTAGGVIERVTRPRAELVTPGARARLTRRPARARSRAP